MKRIAFILPYFGKFPVKGFDLWLLSCKLNPTVDWYVFTDDKTEYNYPDNVKVYYTNLKNIKTRAQSLFDFEISLERPRKLCDFKPVYGEIFAKELRDYDFWGYCDLDLVWGDIRKFLTDQILDSYEKIGYQGHALLYKNRKEVNQRYRTEVPGGVSYRKVLADPREFTFDEVGMDSIYNHLGIPYYQKTIFAHLSKYEYGFFLGHMPKEDDYKNRNQIFLWSRGNLYRKYVVNKQIYTEEYMYIHFFCRPISFCFKSCDEDDEFVIYADKVINKNCDITENYIMKHSKNSRLHYYFSSVWYNRKKLTPRRIYANIKRMVRYKKRGNE